MYTWKGEEDIGRYFGLKGLKCLCVLFKEEINQLRVKAGLPEYTFQQILNKMDTLMETYKNDEAIIDNTKL